MAIMKMNNKRKIDDKRGVLTITFRIRKGKTLAIHRQCRFRQNILVSPLPGRDDKRTRELNPGPTNAWVSARSTIISNDPHAKSGIALVRSSHLQS